MSKKKTEKRKEMNKKLFEKLKDKVTNSGEVCDNLDEARWVFGEEEDKQWLQNAVLEDLFEFQPYKRAAIYSFENKFYFISIGIMDKPDNMPEFMDIFELNSGLFVSIVADKDLNVQVRNNIKANDIIQKVLCIYKGFEDYGGHYLSVLRDFFEPIDVYELKGDCLFNKDDLVRMLGCYICLTDSLVYLPFSDTVVGKYSSIFCFGHNSIPFENLLFSLCSINYKFAFLDLYRCIEMLYTIYYMDRINNIITSITKLEINTLEVASTIQKELLWKYNETNAINSIFESLPPTLIYILQQEKNRHPKQANIKMGEWIYGIRCTIVHHRINQDKEILNDLKWDEIINGMLDIITYLYDKYSLMMF